MKQKRLRTSRILKGILVISAVILQFIKKKIRLNVSPVSTSLMSNFLSDRLKSLKIKRASKNSSIANYKPFLEFENLIFISGQLPIVDEKLIFSGKIDVDLSKKNAIKSIELATSNLLWNLSDIIDLNKSAINIKCLNLKGYLNCSEGFKDHSSLFNVSSDLIINVLGNKNGQHSRSVMGVNSLPKNSPIEIDGIFGLIC